MGNELIKVFPAKEVGTEFTLRVHQKIRSLTRLANNKEQEAKLYEWFKNNFWQIGVDISISKMIVKDMSAEKFQEMKDHYVRNAFFKVQDVWGQDCAIVEEVSPIIIENGLMVGREEWGQWEERYRVSTAGWKMKS